MAFFAAPAGAVGMGPVWPDTFRIAVEIEGAHERREMAPLDNTIARRSSRRNYPLARIILGLGERHTVHARIGVADFTIQERPYPGMTNGRFDGANRMAWGVGFSSLLHVADTWSLGGNAYYFEHRGHSGPWPGIAASDNRIDYREWSVGAQWQVKVRRFLPYAGVRYSDARQVYRQLAGQPSGRTDKARHNLGLYGGIGCTVNRSLRAYIEGRSLDVQAVSGGILYVF